MNKNIIALAVAAAVAAPMAVQAEAAVYGLGQIEIADDGTNRQMGDVGAGRIGVKGSEDLGGGLSAVYNVEFGTDTADNEDGNTKGDTLTSRTSIIGLKGSFGSVTFGRQTSPFGKVGLDPFRASALEARGTSAEIASSAFGNGSFVSNSIMYSNTFGAVTLHAMISANDADGDAGDNAIAVDFKQGPLRVVAAVSSDEDAVTLNTVDRTKIGATYEMSGFTFTAQMENEDDQVAGTDIDYTMLSVAYKMGANTLYARMGSADAGGVSSDHTTFAVTHAMSKSTKVWVGVADDDAFADAVTSVGMQVKF